MSRVNLEMVTVGNPGNSSDPRTGFGGVGYAYKISQYEVTIQQYTDFLNAVAATDPYGLYNPSMATDQTIAGIARSGSPGSYRYSVISPATVQVEAASSPGNRPVAYIDWFDAARFANWMHNGQGSAGTETGAYNLVGAKPGARVPANARARFRIPSQDEWYKAAYYSPVLNKGKGGYYVFPTRSNSTPGAIPGNVASNSAAANQANYYNGTFSVTQRALKSSGNDQNYLTNVGAFISSASHYGTFDQGGNVYEWVDTSGNRNLGRLRGGFWMSNMADMSYVDYYTTSPSYSFDGSGFRLASPVRTNGRSARRNPGFSGDSTDERMDTAFARGSKLGSDHSSTVILAGMAMVAVAQPGNKKDARTGHGSVGYSFNIGNV